MTAGGAVTPPEDHRAALCSHHSDSLSGRHFQTASISCIRIFTSINFPLARVNVVEPCIKVDKTTQNDQCVKLTTGYLSSRSKVAAMNSNKIIILKCTLNFYQLFNYMSCPDWAILNTTKIMKKNYNWHLVCLGSFTQHCRLLQTVSVLWHKCTVFSRPWSNANRKFDAERRTHSETVINATDNKEIRARCGPKHTPLLFFWTTSSLIAGWLFGLPEGALPFHHITSGTGFTATAPWEQSGVPPVFGWPLSYATEQLWNTRESVRVTGEETRRKLNNVDHDTRPVWFRYERASMCRWKARKNN